MKRLHKVLALTLMLLVPTAGAAQKKAAPKKKAKVAAKKPVVETPPEDPRIMEMLEATDQVTFIDSVVVDKKDFLSAYQLNAETGQLLAYNDFFQAKDGPYNTVYLNEMGNKCYFSRGTKLYTSDLLGHEWSEPQQLEGMGTFERMNYPFMMTDGTTFYFAAMGPQSLGGLDIYKTRFDSESGQFLKAENIGMPFNSEANDYMYAVDETDSLGYFATDRRQPDGKVCIYIFIPSTARRTYDIDELGEERVRQLARIDRIRDTWGNGKARRQALERLKALRLKPQHPADGPQQSDFTFIVDDQTTYTQLSDFRVEANAARFRNLRTMKDELEALTAALDTARSAYATAGSDERREMATRILESERQQEELLLNIHRLEKTIRNSEINSKQ